VRREVVQALLSAFNAGFVPYVPAQGSVGASGDLAPLSHMTLALMGEGEALVDGERRPALPELQRLGLTPLTLAAKEGLALINGTQISAPRWRSHALLEASRRVFDSGAGQPARMSPGRGRRGQRFALRRAHPRGARLQPGQIEVAAVLRRPARRQPDPRIAPRKATTRVQDPYCLRCQPQVMGACLDPDAARPPHAADRGQRRSPTTRWSSPRRTRCTLRRQLPRRAGGASPRTCLALAIAEIGSIAERRIAMLIDATHVGPAGLPDRRRRG
jgi:histidine ammonia-lyase